MRLCESRGGGRGAGWRHAVRRDDDLRQGGDAHGVSSSAASRRAISLPALAASRHAAGGVSASRTNWCGRPSPSGTAWCRIELATTARASYLEAVGSLGWLKPSAAHTDAARGRLRLAEDALSAARGAAALLADQAHYARHNVSNATAAVRTAALRVIASETLENLIGGATL